MSKHNDDIKRRFLDSCIANDLGKGRIKKLDYHMKLFIEVLKDKDLDKAFKDKQDMECLVKWINEKDYSDWTKHDLKVSVKKIGKWFNGGEEFPKSVSWIKVTMKQQHKIPEELLTEEDVLHLIKFSLNNRDKAMIMTLYESGCRVGELIGMKIKHVTFIDKGSQLIVNGKTGSRRLLVINSSPFLLDWLNEHPDNKNPNAKLWVQKNGKPMTEFTFRGVLLRTCKRADMKKHIFPHLFRHSRASFLANHLTESQLKEYFGWTQRSSMASVYVHLSGRDTDNALMKLYGLKTEEDKKAEESKLKSKVCFRCKKNNKVTNKFCSNCGASLDVETANVIEKRSKIESKELKEFLQTPKAIELLNDYLRE